MSRTRRFLGGVSLGYVNQALVTIAGLWLTPFLLNRVGQHDYGLWLVGTQLLAYLALMDFGIVALLPRATAYATGRAGSVEDARDLPEIIGQTARIVLYQMPVVVVAAALLWLTMPGEWSALRLPLGLVMLAFVLTFPLRILQAVLQGLQDLAFLARAQIGVWLLSMALTVSFVLMGWGLYALAAGWMAAQVLILPALFFRLRRRFPGVMPRGLPRLPWDAARGKLTSGFWVSVNQVAVVLLIGTDVIIIGKILGAAAVVPYACTVKLAQVFANQPQMLMQAAMPALSELRASRDEQERLARVCIALSQAMLMVSGAVACVVLTTNRGFVQWWVGASQYGGFWLTGLVLLVMLLRHWNLTMGYILFAFGLERRLALTSLLDGVVTVGSGLLLTNWLGLLGAPLGSLAGVCLVSLPYNLIALARAQAIPVSTLMRSLAPWFWRFAALVVASLLLARSFVPDSFATLAATALLSALVYLAVMLPVALRDPLGAYIRPHLPFLGKRVARALGLTGNA